MRPAGPGEGELRCTVCRAPARWFTVQRAWAPDGSYGSHVAWAATCSVDAGHWELPGRPLTASEQSQAS